MQIIRTQCSNGHDWEPALPVELDSAQTLVLVFGTSTLIDTPGPLHELAAAFPKAVLMGCSTAGTMREAGIEVDVITAVVTRFNHTQLKFVSAPLASAADSGAAGGVLAAGLPTEGLRTALVLSAGVHVNGAALVRGIAAGLPETVSVSGGLAGDGERFQRTWVMSAGRPAECMATVVGFYGDALRVGHGCDGGWTDFGPERRITGSTDNVLHELDGKPALALYKHYLGDLADGLPGAALRFPLSMRLPGATDNGRMVVRTILGIDEASQSMTFAGDMPQGATARLMRTTVDQLVTSAGHAADQAMSGLVHDGHRPVGPVLALSVSCIGRRLIMGERTEEEIEAVCDRLPGGSAHTGFYSYGEIAPSEGFSCASLHNQTMTVTMLAEV